MSTELTNSKNLYELIRYIQGADAATAQAMFTSETINAANGQLFIDHAQVLLTRVTPLFGSRVQPLYMAQARYFGSRDEQQLNPLDAIRELELNLRKYEEKVALNLIPGGVAFAASLFAFKGGFKKKTRDFNKYSVVGLTTIGAPIFSPAHDLKIDPIDHDQLYSLVGKLNS